MVLSYVIAFIVALTLGTFKAATHPKFQYWVRYDAAAVRLAQVPVAVLHGIWGLVVAGFANHWNWEPLSSGSGRGAINGAVYGLAAAALLRLEVTSFGLSTFSPARVLLRYGLEFFQEWIDVRVARGVARCVGDLRPRGLCRVSWRLYLRHVAPNCVDEVAAHQAARDLRRTQIQALESEGSPSPEDEVDAMEAQECLRHFCETLITAFADATVDLTDERPVEGESATARTLEEHRPLPPPAHGT